MAAMALPIMLAAEQDLFHMPSAEDVRIQPIARTDNETGWPFSVDSGNLTCVWSGGQKVVFFFEPRPEDLDEDEEFDPRGVLLSVNPLELTIGNIATRGLFAPAGSVEERIRLVAPFAAMGDKLCDQPAGSRVGYGEL
ncbi:hypothetical protein MesoLjLc_27310 [Mesorhizobium sp. L-8-10]|uniref:hypothetical protein n=1 Tax=Mesorhizobium sp. L-8-10 TaxID=2744523 RepID=UPI001937ED9F|nr:hypothetical protein [Mesorhizobium sp. L-8-10]BCH30801.1 hypothetical protein MesoLjLc_27310 [Mesorhizobium sp. L-8-10]